MLEQTNHPDMLRFWRMMNREISEGKQLIGALLCVSETLPPEPMGKAAGALADCVMRGKSLSEAMRYQPWIFPKAHTRLIEGGERVGRLDRVLSIIADLSGESHIRGTLGYLGD